MIVTDLVSGVKGRHTFKFGGEYRNWGFDYHTTAGASGTFNFADTETGLLGPVSGSPIASFLLEQADTGTSAFLPFGTDLRPGAHRGCTLRGYLEGDSQAKRQLRHALGSAYASR